MNDKFKLGDFYTYNINDEKGFPVFSLSGDIVSNSDGFTIIKIGNRDYETYELVMNYDEIHYLFPNFIDPDATERSEYMCIDTHFESLRSFRDLDDLFYGEEDSDSEDEPTDEQIQDLPF